MNINVKLFTANENVSKSNYVAFVGRQQRDIAVFELSCHPSTGLTPMVEALFCSFSLLNDWQRSCEYQELL